METKNSEEVMKELCVKCEKRLDCLSDPLPHHIVYVGEEPCCVGLTPLTVLLPSAEIWQKISVPGAVEISSPETMKVAHAMSQQELDVWFQLGGEELFDLVFSSQNISAPKTVNELKIAGDGVCHVVGMIAMIFVALSQDKKVFLQFPETHLHPKAQSGLASMLHHLTARKEGGEEVQAKP